NAKLTAALEKNAGTANELSVRLLALEQKIVNLRPHNGPVGGPSIGRQIATHANLKAFMESGGRGSCRLSPPRAELQYRSATTDAAAPDQQRQIVGLPQRRLTMRDLLAPGTTSSNLVKFVKQTQRALNAAPVAMGGDKPESDIELSVEEAPVRTI